jgi:hypothetical protein
MQHYGLSIGCHPNITDFTIMTFLVPPWFDPFSVVVVGHVGVVGKQPQERRGTGMKPKYSGGFGVGREVILYPQGHHPNLPPRCLK